MSTSDLSCKLTRLNLGKALKEAILECSDNNTIISVSRKHGWNNDQLCTSWNADNKNRMGVDRVLQYFDRLGYEIRFTVHKKG